MALHPASFCPPQKETLTLSAIRRYAIRCCFNIASVLLQSRVSWPLAGPRRNFPPQFSPAFQLLLALASAAQQLPAWWQHPAPWLVRTRACWPPPSPHQAAKPAGAAACRTASSTASTNASATAPSRTAPLQSRPGSCGRREMRRVLAGYSRGKGDCSAQAGCCHHRPGDPTGGHARRPGLPRPPAALPSSEGHLPRSAASRPRPTRCCHQASHRLRHCDRQPCKAEAFSCAGAGSSQHVLALLGRLSWQPTSEGHKGLADQPGLVQRRMPALPMSDCQQAAADWIPSGGTH
jgi:hypothetical protein